MYMTRPLLGCLVILFHSLLVKCDVSQSVDNGQQILSPSQEVKHDSPIDDGQKKSQDDVLAEHITKHDDENHHGGVHLASWRWEEFSSQTMFIGMIITTVILKIIFHHLPFLEKLLPESCVLIVVGIISGLLINLILFDFKKDIPQFTANLFFNILLPPIIFDAALSLYNKEFFNTFCSVIIFAVFGTLLNVFAIGYGLYGLSYSGVLGSFNVTNSTSGITQEHHLQPIECLIFSSLISAVDPVAVLAIFEEIHVNMGLYFLVFGESLFNDGVTVVLYNTMIILIDLPSVGSVEIFMAILSFFCVVFGGSLIGFLFGIFASFVTKFTRNVTVCEPLLLLSSAYGCFLVAELFHWSGIISIIAYGITAKKYGFQNISQKSFTTVKYAVKTLASTCDCIIFIFLGMEATQEQHYPHTGFIIATIILCLVVRFLSTFLFSALVNTKRMDKISIKEQLIIAYGGLRGAVGFSLAEVLGSDSWYKDLFVTTALVMVFFTVFLQGGTIKFLVKYLKIDLDTQSEPKICLDVQHEVMEDINDGVTSILGRRAASGFLRKVTSKIDKLLKKFLIHEDCKPLLQAKFEKIAMDNHYTNLYAPRLVAEKAERDVVVYCPGHTTSSSSDAIKHFKKGIQTSNWQKFRQTHWEGDRTSKQGLMAELDSREEHSGNLGLRALISMDESSMENNPGMLSDPAERTKLLKAQYNILQAKKKETKEENNASSIVNYLRKASEQKNTK